MTLILSDTDASDGKFSYKLDYLGITSNPQVHMTLKYTDNTC